ncbi:hypothetical protein EMPS_09584 [Entomortierella parvispora]|uniref:Uncharacterized protein n=1 Tax=Entomortierella parvispora TaxID=205924 RepID=A0A9P3HIJ4_9FUNG|nr:hypothetical protein EMPS_09584 [Entomortierella parvispora]
MFMLSWIRSSDASANGTAAAAAAAQDNTDQNQQQHDDWVVLPSDHNDLMSASVSNLELLSSSMTLYHPSSSLSPSPRHTHPAAGRSRNSTHDPASSSSASALLPLLNHKSRRQLKQEQRRQQEMEAMERRPRYDPMMAKLRDTEFKMMKLNKMGLRTGRILSSTTGGANSVKSQQRSSAGSAVTSGAAPLKIC